MSALTLYHPESITSIQNVVIYSSVAEVESMISSPRPKSQIKSWSPRRIPLNYISSSSKVDSDNHLPTDKKDTVETKSTVFEDLRVEISPDGSFGEVEEKQGSKTKDIETIEKYPNEVEQVIDIPSQTLLPEVVLERFLQQMSSSLNDCDDFGEDDCQRKQRGWSDIELTNKIIDEVIRIQERSKVSPEESVNMIQSALYIDPVKVARELVDEQPYKDLEQDESSFITGDKNLITLRPLDCARLLLKTKKKKEKKTSSHGGYSNNNQNNNNIISTSKPSKLCLDNHKNTRPIKSIKAISKQKSKSKLRNQIVTESTLDDIKLLKAYDEIERSRHRMIVKGSQGLISKKGKIERNCNHDRDCDRDNNVMKKWNEYSNDPCCLSTRKSRVGSSQSDQISNYSDLFAEYHQSNNMNPDERARSNDELFSNSLSRKSSALSGYDYNYDSKDHIDLETSVEEWEESLNRSYHTSRTISASSLVSPLASPLASSLSILSSLTDSKHPRDHMMSSHELIQELVNIPFSNWRKMGKSRSQILTGPVTMMKEDEDKDNYGEDHLLDESESQSQGHDQGDDKDDPLMNEIYSKLSDFEAVVSNVNTRYHSARNITATTLRGRGSSVTMTMTMTESNNSPKTKSSVVSLPKINTTGTLKKSQSVEHHLHPYHPSVSSTSNRFPAILAEDSISDGSLDKLVEIKGVKETKDVQEEKDSKKTKALFAALNAGDAVGNLISNLLLKAMQPNRNKLISNNGDHNDSNANNSNASDINNSKNCVM